MKFRDYIESLPGKAYHMNYYGTNEPILITKVVETRYQNWHIHFKYLRNNRDARCTPYWKQMKWLNTLEEMTQEELDNWKVQLL